MQETLPRGDVHLRGDIYLRIDALEKALDEAVGPRPLASEQARAKHLGITYQTYWRYQQRKGARRKTQERKVSAQFMYAVMSAFPDSHPSEFFEVRENRQMAVAA